MVVDTLLVERVRLHYARICNELRELEAYKIKRGICTAGISCLRKAVAGPRGSLRFCAHHKAAQKAGIKLGRWVAYQSEYGKLRKKQLEAEREARERPAHRAPKKKKAA